MKTHKGLSSRKYEVKSKYQNIPSADFFGPRSTHFQNFIFFGIFSKKEAKHKNKVFFYEPITHRTEALLNQREHKVKLFNPVFETKIKTSKSHLDEKHFYPFSENFWCVDLWITNKKPVSIYQFRYQNTAKKWRYTNNLKYVKKLY